MMLLCLDRLDQIATQSSRVAKAFEHTYLNKIIREHDRVDVLGIRRLDDESRTADLSIAYLVAQGEFKESRPAKRDGFSHHFGFDAHLRQSLDRRRFRRWRAKAR